MIDNITTGIDVREGLVSSAENSRLNMTSMPSSATASLNMDEQKLSEVGNMILQYGVVALLPIGLTFNILSFVYFMHRCCKNATVSAIYLASLSLADALTVMALFVAVFPSTLSPPISLTWLSGCNILHLAVYIPSHVSTLIITIIAVDRFLALYFPFKFRQMQSKSKAILVVALVTLLACAINFYAFGGMKPEENLQHAYILLQCSGRNNIIHLYFTMIFPWVDFAVYFMIPAVVLLFFNILIIKKVMHEKLRKQKSSPDESSDNKSQQTGQALNKYGRHLTRLSIALSVSFVILVGPFNLWHLALYFGAGDEMTNSAQTLVGNVTQILTMMNHCVNFIFYVICIPSLRKDLLAKVSQTLCRLHLLCDLHP